MTDKIPGSGAAFHLKAPADFWQASFRGWVESVIPGALQLCVLDDASQTLAQFIFWEHFHFIWFFCGLQCYFQSSLIRYFLPYVKASFRVQLRGQINRQSRVLFGHPFSIFVQTYSISG